MNFLYSTNNKTKNNIYIYKHCFIGTIVLIVIGNNQGH